MVQHIACTILMHIKSMVEERRERIGKEGSIRVIQFFVSIVDNVYAGSDVSV